MADLERAPRPRPRPDRSATTRPATDPKPPAATSWAQRALEALDGLAGEGEPSAPGAPAPQVAVAQDALERATQRRLRLEAESQDEAAKGGRGPRYDDIQERLAEAEAAEDAALQGVSAAERAAYQASALGQIDAFAKTGGAVIAGIAAGKIFAHYAVNKPFEHAVAARNVELRGVASVMEKTLRGNSKTKVAQLRGGVAAVDKLGLASLRGPKPIITAGLLAVDGLLIRHMAGKLEDENAREVVGAAGIALTAGAGALIGQAAIGNATMKPLDGRAMAIIESGRAVVNEADAAKLAKRGGRAAVLGPGGPVPPKTGGIASRVASALPTTARGRIGLAVLAAGTAATALAASGAAQAADGDGRAYLGADARDASRAPARSGQRPAAPSGRVTYTTADGRTVTTTRARAAAYRARRK